MFEHFGNGVSTILNSGIDASQTSFDVDDGSIFPAPNFRIIIDSEIMLVTDVSSNTLTVLRAQEGTVAGSHGSGAGVVHIITAAGFRRTLLDRQPVLLSASYPTGVIQDNSGAIIGDSGFTPINLSGSTVTHGDLNGSIYMDIPASQGANWRLLGLATPGQPYEYLAAFCVDFIGAPSGSARRAAVGLRESGTGKMAMISLASTGGFDQVLYLTGRTATGLTNEGTLITPPSGAPTSRPWRSFSQIIWVKLQENSTNVVLQVSLNGRAWWTIYDTAKTTPFTTAPDQIVFGGWFGGLSGGTPMSVYLVHLSRLS